MNFGDQQSQLQDMVGAYDKSVAADATKLKRWLNLGQQYVCGKANWPFMLAYEVIQTVKDITTGTVSINAAATALTFSSAPAASVAGMYIQLSTSDDWYRISAHTAGATAATLATAYVGSTNLSAGTYKVRKLLYATATPLDSLLDIKKTVNPNQLVSLNQRSGDFFTPLYLAAGDPVGYINAPPDSSGNPQFSLVQSPDTVLNLLVRGINKLSDLSADSDTSVIPKRWHDAIINAAAYYAFLGIKEERAIASMNLANQIIADMARVFNTDLGRHRVMASIDGGYEGPTRNLGPDFGPTYTL